MTHKSNIQMNKMQKCAYVSKAENGYDKYQICGRMTTSPNGICPMHVTDKNITLKDDVCKHHISDNGICGNSIYNGNKCYYHYMNQIWVTRISILLVLVSSIRLCVYGLSFLLKEQNFYLSILLIFLCYILTTLITIFFIIQFNDTGIELCRYEREDGKVCSRPTDGYDIYVCEDHLDKEPRTKCMYREYPVLTPIRQQWTRPGCTVQKEDNTKSLCDHHDNKIRQMSRKNCIMLFMDLSVMCTLAFFVQSSPLWIFVGTVCSTCINLFCQILYVFGDHGELYYMKYEYKPYIEQFNF